MCVAAALFLTARVATGAQKGNDKAGKAAPANEDPDKAGVVPGKAGFDPDKAPDEKKSGNDAKKKQVAVLTVVVTGAGKPISQAEVKLKLPSADGAETILSTNKAGEVTIRSAAMGGVKVRVIATGWNSVMREIVIKEGAQRLAIELTAFSETK